MITIREFEPKHDSEEHRTISLFNGKTYTNKFVRLGILNCCNQNPND